MIQAAINNCYLEVKHTATRTKGDIVLLASMQHDSSINLMDFITITGNIVSIPKKIVPERGITGFSTKNIQVGDKAIFSYLVVGDLKIENNEHKHTNLVWYKGKQLFTASIDKIFAVIHNGEIIMINGYVMITEFETSKIILPHYMSKIKIAAKAQVLNIGNPKENEKQIDAKQGDTVYFNPNLAQKYNINEKKFCILQQSQILGKEV